MKKGTEYTRSVDALAGSRVNELRIAMGLSRSQLGEQIGVTHQQMSKYENGENRISVGRLALIAKVMKQPISYFFDEEIVQLPDEHQRMAMEVSRNFLKVRKPEYRMAINDMIRILGKE